MRNRRSPAKHPSQTSLKSDRSTPTPFQRRSAKNNTRGAAPVRAEGFRRTLPPEEPLQQKHPSIPRYQRRQVDNPSRPCENPFTLV